MLTEISENVSSEVILTSNNGYNLIWLYVIWICFFFTTALPNLIVSLTVMRYRALRGRKEYLIVAGLSFADFIETTGYSIAGLHRLVLIFADQWTLNSSAWSCVMLVHNVFWWFSTPTTGIMLVVVSLDRFLSVRSPIKYFKMTKTYAHHLLGVVYGFGICMCLLIIGLTYAQMQANTQLVAPCFAGATVLAVNEYYAVFYMYVPSVTGLLSVVLYVGVGVTYWKKKHKIATNAEQTQITLDRKRQRTLTKNLAISSLCTTVFLVIPNGVAMAAERVYELPRWVIQFIWLLPPINPFCNGIIYYKRLSPLRKGMRALLVNKIMPENLDLWNVNSTKHHRVGNQGLNHG